jgi:hypothetical protein
MKRQRWIAVFMIAVLVLPLVSSRTASAQVADNSLINVWVFQDHDRNGVYSAGDGGAQLIEVTLKSSGETLTGVTSYGLKVWEITEAGKFTVTVNVPILRGDEIVSILCIDANTGLEYADCKYNLKKSKAIITLPLGIEVNIYYAMQAKPPVPTSTISVWVFADMDGDRIHSAGDLDLHAVAMTLENKQIDLFFVGGTDYGEHEWKVRWEGKYIVRVDPATTPGYQLVSIYCIDVDTGEAFACQTNIKHWRTQFYLPHGRFLRVYYVLEPVP